MTGHVTDDPPEVEPDERLLARLPSPTILAVLGFLAVPAWVLPGVERGEVFGLFFLFGLWPLLQGVVGSVLPSGEDEPDPTAWIRMEPGPSWRILVSMVYLQGNPFLQWRAVRQLAAPAVILPRYRFRLPDPTTGEQRTDVRLPFDGEWTVVNGGPTRAESHSWGLLTQRYAYDFVVTDDDGRSYDGDGDDPSDFHCWEAPVLAPADGVVVAASDGHRDHHRVGWLDPRQRDIYGNFVVVEHDGSADGGHGRGRGEYSVLAHLREGSVRVSEGDRVQRGETIARCGHSGNSTEPHLHFHVQDGPRRSWSMGLPVHFGAVRTRSPDGEVTDHDRAYVRAGQRVSSLEGGRTETAAGVREDAKATATTPATPGEETADAE